MKRLITLSLLCCSLLLNNVIIGQTCWQRVSSVVDPYFRIVKYENNVYLASSGNCTGIGPASANSLYTSNNLISWTPSTISLGSLAGLAFNIDNDRNLFLSTQHAGIYSSGDTGISWNYANVGNGFGCMALDFEKDSINNLYAGISGALRGLYVSTDNASTWTNKIPGRDIPDIEVVNSTHQIYTVNSDLWVFFSSDNGNTWTQITGQPFSNNTVMVKHYNSQIFIFTNNGNIYQSSDAGLSWSLYSNIPILGTAAYLPNDAIFVDASIWWVGFSSLNGVWRSSDSGHTWTKEDSCLVGEFHYLFKEGSSVLATTSNGIFKFEECNLTIDNQPSNQNISVSSTAQFTTASTDPMATYQWQSDLGVGFQNINSVGQYSGTNKDTLRVANVTMGNNNQPFRCIVSSGACSDTSDAAVLTVINANGINETSTNNLFTVYPNPAKSQINVKADATLIGSSYTVYNNIGNVTLTGKINAENTVLDLGHLSSGVYLFSIGDSLKQRFTVVKE